LVASLRPESRRGLVGSLGLALVGFTLVAAPWYSVNLVPSLSNLVSAGFGRTSIPYRGAGEGILTWNSLSYYPRFVLGYGLGLPSVILVLSLASGRAISTWRERRRITLDVRSRLASPSVILGVCLLTMYVVL